MFTGLVESEGIITRTERVSDGMRLEVYAPEFGRDMAIGDSIAVDGACLTVAKFIRGAFMADVSSETLSRTTLAEFVRVPR
jgi:riboflavin synthase